MKDFFCFFLCGLLLYAYLCGTKLAVDERLNGYRLSVIGYRNPSKVEGLKSKVDERLSEAVEIVEYF